MNLSKLMKQAQKMQEQMARTQAELANRTVEVEAGGGRVRVTANGEGEVIAIKINAEVADPNDVAFLEELMLSGVKQAIEQGTALAQSELAKITGGLNLPGLQARRAADGARTGTAALFGANNFGVEIGLQLLRNSHRS